jgi:alpha-L-arabinofuranosidase
VTNVNEAPTITSNGGNATATISYAENGTEAVTTVQATDADADAGAALTYSISGGAQQNSFDINGTTGALTFKTSPNYEDTLKTYVVIVKASDGTNEDTQTITVNVTDVNDNTPEITSNSGGPTATVSYAENGTVAVTTVQATDADAGTTLTYSISGGAQQSAFDINGTTGALTFKTSPNYEVDPLTYEVIVKVSDGTNEDTQTITITVTNVNEAPTNMTLSLATIATGSTGNNVDVGTLTTTDADAGNTFTYTLVSGVGDTDNALFNISDDDVRTVGSTAAGTYTIRIRVTDNTTLTFEKEFTITVT